MIKIKIRKNSIGFCGGAFGDEGKGRLVDKYVSDFAKRGDVVVYRDNGGSNAGHTVEFENGERVSLHQLPSGVFVKGATLVLGKNMVLHPQDLIEELNMVKKAVKGKVPAKILIDELATLCLDTHRAYEAALATWQGATGATGRGISPAYADILYRHPLKMRDLKAFNEEKIRKHYKMYKALIKGLGLELEQMEVPVLNSDVKIKVGTEDSFVNNLKASKTVLSAYIQNVFSVIQNAWKNEKIGFVFEKGQAIGLSADWGVYPDVTVSNTTFDGIFTSTEGIVDPQNIMYKAEVIKATYMSSVGKRVLPSKMEEGLANKIREDAMEYGATTKRPRGIAYIDIPALKYFAHVGKTNCLVLTHMDIVYPNTPVKVCVQYKIKGKEVSYRPDQEYLNQVTPVYREFKTWDRAIISKAKKEADMPTNAKTYLKFISKELGLPVLAVTTGPKREQGMIFKI